MHCVAQVVDHEDPSILVMPGPPRLTGIVAEEVAFQKSWVAYMWARAAAAHVEPQV